MIFYHTSLGSPPHSPHPQVWSFSWQPKNTVMFFLVIFKPFQAIFTLFTTPKSSVALKSSRLLNQEEMSWKGWYCCQLRYWLERWGRTFPVSLSYTLSSEHLNGCSEPWFRDWVCYENFCKELLSLIQAWRAAEGREEPSISNSKKKKKLL